MENYTFYGLYFKDRLDSHITLKFGEGVLEGRAKH